MTSAQHNTIRFVVYSDKEPGSLRGRSGRVYPGQRGYRESDFAKDLAKKKKDQQDKMDRADEDNESERDKAYRGRR